MSTLKLTNLQTAAGVANLSINASTGQVTLPSGLEPVITSRANISPGGGLISEDAMGLQLTSLNEIHYYETTGDTLWLYTRMLPNAIYEVTYTSSGGSENTDFGLFPNGASYAGQFNSHYRYTNGANGNFDQVNQTGLSYMYFDHQAGGDGNESMGRMTIHSGTSNLPGDLSGFNNKMMFYFGADDGTNVAYGYNRWADNTVPWTWIGYISFSGNNKRAWVRRIA